MTVRSRMARSELYRSIGRAFLALAEGEAILDDGEDDDDGGAFGVVFEDEQPTRLRRTAPPADLEPAPARERASSTVATCPEHGGELRRGKRGLYCPNKGGRFEDENGWCSYRP